MTETKKPDIQHHLDEINKILGACWLQSHVARYDFDPRRNKEGVPYVDMAGSKPMDRFVFMADCYTSLDGEISEDGEGFRIIHNAHQRGRYVEDGAFYGDQWIKGTFIPFSLFKLAAAYYVALANTRAGANFDYQQWPIKSIFVKPTVHTFGSDKK